MENTPDETTIQILLEGSEVQMQKRECCCLTWLFVLQIGGIVILAVGLIVLFVKLLG